MTSTSSSRENGAPRGSAGRVLAGVALGIVGAANCLYWVAVWLLHRLAENRPETGTWQDDVDAWQWSAMGWLGIASLVCCVAAAIALGRRWRLAPVLVGAAVITGVAPWIVYATG